MHLQRQPGHSNVALRRPLMILGVRVLDRPMLSNKPLQTDGERQGVRQTYLGTMRSTVGKYVR
jgi:hypothetical protein